MSKKVVFTFGRFQVPTKGHAELVEFVMNYARKIGAEPRIYTSKSHDPLKNPLPYKQKIAFLRQLFPGASIIDDPSLNTAFAICKKLSDTGVDDVTMVVGADRVDEFKRGIGKYVMDPKNPKFDKTKNYAFKKFNVISSGARHEGVSGTQMRTFIRQGKFDDFMKVAPTRNRTLARQIFTTAKEYLREEAEVANGMTRKEFHKALMSFVDYTCNKLDIKEKPSIRYRDSDDHSSQPSFGGYSPSTKELVVVSKNRHPMDIFRTVAHELVHHKQNENGLLSGNVEEAGKTGSAIENEANSEAGKVMRYFGKDNPFYFDMSYVTENKAIILGGAPGSGKDRILKETILPHGFREISADEFHKMEKFEFSENLVINGTASDYTKTLIIKETLETYGYDVMMIFVNTSNEVSKLRNEERVNKSGRVIPEFQRYSKWMASQENLYQYRDLFENFVEIDNSIDLNKAPKNLINEHRNILESLSERIRLYSSEIDYKFEQMLNEVGGAGNWGTPRLTNTYKKDTPGQEPGPFRKMKVLSFKEQKNNDKTNKTKVSLNLGQGDRVGQEYGFPKSPGFGTPFDDASVSTVSYNDPVGRWMVKEETKKLFKEKYGKLAEQKMKETAEKLLRRESLTDPYSGSTSTVATTSGPIDDQRPDPNAEFEKTSLFRKRKRLNNKR